MGLSSPRDAWIGYQFDMAAAKLGIWCENMLAERTKAGQPRYSLIGLLADQSKVFARQFRQDFDRFPIEEVDDFPEIA